jgi:3-deoxy-manno-octulosonate cytidylyltransferase (CMP-KDO synthetase)
LPGKALIPLAGKPLLQHVWERSRAAQLGSDPLVATDDERIAIAARSFGAPVVMTSAKHRCGSERVAEVATGLTADIVVNVQGDEVLIDPELLARLPSVFSDATVQMATPVVPLQDRKRLVDPSLVKAVLDDRQQILYFSRSPIPYPERDSSAQITFYGHVGVYAFRRQLLLDVYSRPASSLELAEGLEQLRVLQAGYRIQAQIWPQADFGVNTPEDLERVRRRNFRGV